MWSLRVTLNELGFCFHMYLDLHWIFGTKVNKNNDIIENVIEKSLTGLFISSYSSTSGYVITFLGSPGKD